MDKEIKEMHECYVELAKSSKICLRVSVSKIVYLKGSEYTLQFLRYAKKHQCSLVGGELIYAPN